MFATRRPETPKPRCYLDGVMPHLSAWHLLDGAFAADRGIAVPTPRRSLGSASLAIAPGGATQLQLSPAPSMPTISVACAVGGFDPARTLIAWRLVCRHVPGRWVNTGAYRYRAVSRVLEREWRGESKLASFRIFDPADAGCACTYNQAGCVMGGDAVLMVAAQVPGGTLCDALRLRITGSNPNPTTVLDWLDQRLAGYDPNVVRMLRAIFAHEAGFRQFSAIPQSGATMTFTSRYHGAGQQPDCAVRFQWPAEPAGFPLISFDFGVGISQFTDPARLTPDIAWDWRENLRIGINLFLEKLRRVWRPGACWMDLAMSAWAAYNGTGSSAAVYARGLAASPEGSLVARAAPPTPPHLDAVDPPAALAAPGEWLAA